MRPILLAFGSVVAVSAVSLIGLITLSMRESRVRKLATFFVSFAVGALLGDAFLHLVPETLARTRSLLAPLLILGGMLIFFALEKMRTDVATLNVIGDAIHNYIDGLLIGASWLASPSLGISTTLAVLLHEIPQELGDFGILIHSGLTVRRATLLNVASAAVAILGTTTAIVAGAVAHERVIAMLVPMTAGGFIYIAAANLIPQLQRERTLRASLTQIALISAGVAIMAALTIVE